MKLFEVLPRRRHFEMLSHLNQENRGDHKVVMISEVDLTAIETLRQTFGTSGEKPSYTSCLAKSIILALKKNPASNRFVWDFPFWTRLVQLSTYDISVAVEKDTPGSEQAVYVGTIRGANAKSLLEVNAELKEFASATPENSTRVRNWKFFFEKFWWVWLAKQLISLPRYFPSLWIEHRGGAVVISSPAKYGVDIMVAHWPWPVGFSFGLVKDRPIVVGHEIQIKKTMYVTMSFDRRIMAGAPAARFFKDVCSFLENPDKLNAKF
ncbi:MAG TPA: 2-oxo acid dehydrogenase subunit E2 [Pseudobdellovibrionaceae bacterium]|nr:2-oxo acid dehydrogenase subunit E2 [Pseudobdellovibrionaceae bacterium]